MKQYLMEDEKTSFLKKNTSKKRGRQKCLRITALILTGLVAAGVGVWGFRISGGAKLRHAAQAEALASPDEASTEHGGKTVSYGGKQWEYNEDVIAILCIGVDEEQQHTPESTAQDPDMKDVADSYQRGGFADTLFVLAVDTKKGSCVLLPVSRYTMGMIDIYHIDGTYLGQKEMQLTYAYAYGDGGAKSCENTVKAVSRLLYGIPFSGYVALDMSGVEALNDLVGGVTISIQEDLTDADPAFFAGNTVTLTGEQALRFVRYRVSEGDALEADNNAPRMQRQEQFLHAFLQQLFSQIRKDPGLPLNCYQLLKNYMVTDISPSETLYLSTLLAKNVNDADMVNLPGTVQRGTYTEVYVDRQRLYEILLDIFFTEQS